MRDDLPERLSLITLTKASEAAHERGEEYRDRARQLFTMAETETDPTLRGNLLMLAGQYEELAADDQDQPSASPVPPVEHPQQRDATTLPVEPRAGAAMAPENYFFETCLARAAECERLAEQAWLKVAKDTYLGLAQRWRKLATESEGVAFEPVGAPLSS